MAGRASRASLGELYRSFSAFVFGYDVFLSYRQSDALAYATQLVVALTDQGFVCFFDREETAAGVVLKPAIERALRRSRTMVVVLTPGVTKSAWIRQEVTYFLGRPNRLLPINVGGSLSRTEFDAPPFVALRNRTWLDETEEALAAGAPSAGISDQIRSCQRRMRVKRLALLLMLAIVAFLAVGGTALGRYFYEQRRQAAIAEADLRRNLRDIEDVLRMLVEPSIPTIGDTLSPERLRTDLWRSQEVIAAFSNMDLADTRFSNSGPFLRLRASPTGPGVTLLMAMSREIRDVLAELDELRRKHLALLDGDLLQAVGEVANDSFAKRFSEAPFFLRRYREIEDSSRVQFYLLGGPGRPSLSTVDAYKKFIDKLEVCWNHLSND